MFDFDVFFKEMFSLFLTGRFVKALTPWYTSSLMKSLSVPSSMITGKSEIEIFSDWNKRFPVRWEKMISSVSHKSHVWLTSRLPLYLWFQVNMTPHSSGEDWRELSAGWPRREQSRPHWLLPGGAAEDQRDRQQHVSSSRVLPGQQSVRLLLNVSF